MSDEDAKKLAATEQSISRVSSDVASLNVTFQRRQLFSAQLSIRCDQLQRVNTENEAELASAENELKRHREEVADARQRAATLRADIDAIKTQLDDEKQQHEALQHQLEEIKSAKGTAHEKNKALSQLAKVSLIFFLDSLPRNNL